MATSRENRVVIRKVESKVVVRETKGLGRGVFAVKRIRSGELIAAFEGRVYHAERISLLPNDPPGFLRDHVIQTGPREYLHGKGGLAELINHSCSPNCGIKKRVEVVAMRDIAPGEQVTWDYEMSENSDWEMKCQCGSQECRGIIRGYDYMPEAIRRRYRGFISEWLVTDSKKE